MTHDELKYKEQRLRECFKKKLLMAEEGEQKRGYTTTADTMNVQATGLKMGGTK